MLCILSVNISVKLLENYKQLYYILCKKLTISQFVLISFSLRIRPHMLRGISKVDTTADILGHPIDFPVCIAPLASQKMAHPEGEIGTAKGSFNSLYVALLN